ncbi:MAG: chemotaxis protein CheD [Peptococcia bacterium]|jgi:chemotaxis protein CheD
MSSEPIKIGIAELKTAFSPATLFTAGLGSCIGVCLWDPKIKLGGIVHIMLPDSTLGRNHVINKAKYVDTGIRALIDEMLSKGANKRRLVAKIAGGAQMFIMQSNLEMLKIGERNIEAVRNELKHQNIKLISEDVGGNYGRTIEFFTENGQLLVKSIYKGVKII